MNPEEFDAAVIGAGAAGMMCAARAGQRGRRVVLIDHAGKIGEKIRISGGGRCNFTNLHCRPEHYLSRNPHFCRSALARYQPKDFIALVERYGIGHHEKTLGQLFCDESAVAIVAMLRAECDRAGVQWRVPCAVSSIERVAAGFRLSTEHGEVRTRSVVIATGGLTVPKIGASPFGYRVAEQFGLAVVPPRPALVPLACDAPWLELWGDLAGVSTEVVAACGGGRFRESMLFTHRGLSGPAILQISSFWDGSEPIVIDLLPGRDAQAWLVAEQPGRARFDNLLAQVLPRRLAQRWCEVHDLARPMNEITVKRVRAAAQALQRWEVRPAGTLGYNKAEVTLGGVDTAGLSSRTMEATSVPGLYFIGEVVDVTGHLGGFNFQWAWSSGHAAGEAV